MRIEAKADGRCQVCGEEFPKGEIVVWDRDLGARHVECDNKLQGEQKTCPTNREKNTDL